MAKQSSTRTLAAGRRPRAARSGRRRGITSLLAMLYLVVFSAIALGFYAQTNVARQISSSEHRLTEALVAAESGVAFLKYHLSALNIPHLPPAQRLEEIYMQLSARLDGSASLGGGIVGYDGNAIYIPDGTNSYVRTTPGGPGFRARIKIKNDYSLQVKFVGRHNAATKGVGRGIEVYFGTEQRESPLLKKYAVAARGPVNVSGNGIIRGVPDPTYGSVFVATSASPAVTMTGPSEISGDIYLSSATTTTSIASGCIVGGAVGTDIAAHIHKPVAMPEFPAIDTSVFLPYVTSTYTIVSGNKVKNVRIPAGTGTAAVPLKFGTGATIDGVMYVESPNVIKFEGTCAIRGVIVGPNTTTGGITANVLTFAGTAESYDMSTLPDSIDFPPALKRLTGSSIVTPGFHVQFSGGYAAISGSIASSQLTFSGKAGGNISGNILGLGNQVLTVSGSSEVFLQKPSTNQWPAGVFFRSRYVPRKDSYLEVPADDPPAPAPIVETSPTLDVLNS